MTARAAALVFVTALTLTTWQPAIARHHGSHVVVPPGQLAPRVGPSYLYPDPETTPGVTNPEVTQANIHQTICVRGWTGTIRPLRSYTDTLKRQQLQAPRFTDKNPAHYEEDLCLARTGGQSPRCQEPVARNVGDAGHPADLSWTLSAVTRWRQGQGQNGERPELGGLHRHDDPSGGSADHQDRLVQVLSGPGAEVGSEGTCQNSGGVYTRGLSPIS